MVLQTLVVLKPNWLWKQIRGERIVLIYNQVYVLTMMNTYLKVARNSFQHLYFDGSLQPLFFT